MNQNEAQASLTGGTVTRIGSQRKKPERVSIFVDGAFALGVHRDVLLDHPLRRGEAVSAEQLGEMAAADEFIRARKRALDLLAYRPRTEREVRDRLSRDGFSDAPVESAVARMLELGYVDDASFAVEFAASRFRSRGYGRHRLERELRTRGIAPATAQEAAFAAVGEGEDEYDRALEFAHKRMRTLGAEADVRKRRKKLFDALMRRGYGPDLIRRVADEVLE
jgi:regulatory protein